MLFHAIILIGNNADSELPLSEPASFLSYPKLFWMQPRLGVSFTVHTQRKHLLRYLVIKINRHLTILIQTAIENSLDPYKYLVWLLQEAKDADLTDVKVVQRLLPWNAAAEC